MQSLKKHFGITTLLGNLMHHDKKLWLFPQRFEAVQNKIKYARLGIQIGITHKNGVRLTHEFATVLGNECKTNIYALNNEQANDYFQGKYIRLAEATLTISEVVLTLCGCPIGIGKWQKIRSKIHYHAI